MPIGLRDFFGLFRQYARKRDARCWARRACQYRFQYDQRAGQNVGDDYIRADRVYLARYALRGRSASLIKLQLCFAAAIEQCVLTAGVNCLRIDIESNDAMRTQFRGGNGEYARTTAVIQNIFSPTQAFVKPCQAKLSRGMTTRAKSKAGIEYQVHGVWIGYLMPAGTTHKRGDIRMG